MSFLSPQDTWLPTIGCICYIKWQTCDCRANHRPAQIIRSNSYPHAGPSSSSFKGSSENISIFFFFLSIPIQSIFHVLPRFSNNLKLHASRERVCHSPIVSREKITVLAFCIARRQQIALQCQSWQIESIHSLTTCRFRYVIASNQSRRAWLCTYFEEYLVYYII